MEIQALPLKYVFKRVIAQDSYSHTFQAVLKGRPIWLKVVRIGLLSDSLTNLLNRQLLILSKLRHRGLLRYLNSYIVDEHLVIQLQQPRNTRTLASDISHRKLSFSAYSEKEIVGLAKEVAGILLYLHEHGIYHRDLRPTNIYTGQDNLVIADLMLSQHLASKNFSRIGHIQVPEMAQSVYDQRVDTYCLGVTLLAMMTLEADQTTFRAEFLQKSFYSARLVSVINKMCTQNPSKRPKMKEVILQLSKLNEFRTVLRTFSKQPMTLMLRRQQSTQSMQKVQKQHSLMSTLDVDQVYKRKERLYRTRKICNRKMIGLDGYC